MANDLNSALDVVDMSYSELIDVANEIYNAAAGPTKQLIKSIVDRGQNLTIDQIRECMLQLSLNSFTFAEIKEKSAFKAELAETIRKAEYSKAFSKSSGTNASARDAQATTEVAYEILTEHLYSLIANMLKTTLDESHRVVDTMKSILMSRMAEAKLSSNLSIGQPGETYITE